jgi:hypothetical protein
MALAVIIMARNGFMDFSVAEVVSQFVENVSSEETFDERMAALLHSR